MDFKDLCSFFEQIKETKTLNDKKKLIRERFKKIRDENRCSPSFDFFQILRLFLPNYDRERGSFNMKEAKMSRVLTKLLDLPPGHDRNVLSKSHLMAGQATDFGDVVYSVIKKYLRSYKNHVTVDDVNKFLDDITKRQNEHEAEQAMMQMFQKMPAENIRWIIRIILKDLKLGVSSNTILNCYHRDGAAYYATNNSLKKVCEVLADENVKLNELEIEIFEPFRPMLSKRIDNSNFKKEFAENKQFYVEEKFDGERFQLHMKDGNFMYFSRNGFNYTDNLGKNYETGIFTPKLKGLLEPTIRKLILDGELMLWDTKHKNFGCKGMALDVKKLNDTGRYQPCFCVFDIIMLDDRILTNQPLKERKEILETVFRGFKDGVVMVSKVKRVSSRKEIVDELNEVGRRGDEGIVVKDPDSVYKYSDRNSGWYKMKLEYFQDSMNDLDLIVMGGKFASSTRDTLNSFVVGVRSGNAADGRATYRSLGKVTSGLNNQQLEEVDQLLKTKGKKYDTAAGATDVLIFGKEKPDYYIEPQHSLVFQIRATELIRNTDNSFATSYTLRFPRILNVRRDKPVDECLTLDELLDLTRTNKAVIKLAKGSIELEELLRASTRKVIKPKLEMPTIYDTRKVSDILEGYTIYLLNGTEKMSKEQAESVIRKLGGDTSFRLVDTVDIVLVGTRTDKIRELVSRRAKYDIVDLNWLQRIMEEGNLLPYQQDEVYYIAPSYKNTLSDGLDMYGDSYTEPTTVQLLKRTFETIERMGDFSNRNGTLRFVAGCRRDYAGYNAYFDRYAVPNDPTSEVIYDSFVDEIEFRFYKGNVRDTICDDVNLLVYTGDEGRRVFLQRYLRDADRSDIELRCKSFLYE